MPNSTSSNTWLTPTPNGFLLQVLVQPRASRTQLVGLHGSPPRMKIRLAAPPVDGEANQALIEFLSKLLSVPKSKIAIVHGLTSRRKDLIFQGLSLEHAQALLQPPQEAD